MLQTVDAGVLRVAYLEHGSADSGVDAVPVILLHGFPYDVHAYDAVSPLLVAAGHRVIVPYLRGYGPTRFLSGATPRSGEQAALAADLLALMDALAIPKSVLAGYDWGGRAACIVAALWPERVSGLVTGNGYNVQNIALSSEPADPLEEHRLWYQYYFHSERGRHGLERDRRAFCKLLWRLWSPSWNFDAVDFERSAASFDNPDFIDVVIHSYRHRYALVAGDPDVEDIERKLAKQPLIGVPTVALDGADDEVMALNGCAGHERYFSGRYERRVLDGVGHNIPQEAPRAFADAIMRCG